MDSDKKNPLKSSSTILAVGFFLAVLVGANHFFRQENHKPDSARLFSDADLIIIPKTAEKFSSRFVVSDTEKPLYLPPGTLEKLSSEPEINRLTYQVHLGKPPSDCCTYIDGPIIAFEEESDFILSPLIAERRKKEPMLNNELLEGSAIHDYLGLITDIQLFSNDTKITGYLKRTGTNLDNCIFMRVKDIAEISNEYLPDYPPAGISVIFIQLNKTVGVKDFIAKIQQTYPDITVLPAG